MDNTPGSAGVSPDLYSRLLNPDNYSFDPLGLLHFAAALIVAVTGAWVMYRERGSRVSRYFAAFCALFFLWAAGRGVLRLLADPELMGAVARGVNALVMVGLPFLYQFAMTLLRCDGRRVAMIRFNWVVGITLAVACVGTPWVIGGTRAYAWGLEPVFGVYGYFSMLWVGAMMALGGADAWRAWRQALPGSLERRRVLLFDAALVVLALAAVDFLPAAGIAVYPAGFGPIAAFTLITAWITLRFGLVTITPQLVAGEVASLIRGGLLILDQDGVIQIVNDEARRLLAPDRDTLVGTPASTLMAGAFGTDQLARLAHAQGREAEHEFLYQPGAGGPVRSLSMSAVVVRDSQRREVAYACLLRDVTEQKRLRQRRATDRRADTLTGLPDRAFFLDVLSRMVERAGESADYDYAVCCLGLDRLRVINEELGVETGDQVLVEVARRLRSVMRARDVVARIGGDEFGILLDAAGPQALPPLLRRMQAVIQAPLKLSDHDLHLSASIGVAESTWAYASGTEVLRDAGIAMHHIKQEGGGGVEVIGRSDHGAHRTRLEAELRRALESEQLQVYYQPVLDLTERRVAGFEALVRWQHPERGLVLPGAFIEFAEQIGLGEKIDMQVMERACSDLARMRSAMHSNRVTISFNLAEGSLRNPAFAKHMAGQLHRCGLDPACVRIELLERVAMIGPIYGTLAQLRGLGLGLYIDDFGTGYSSLGRLHKLPITTLKIDREFVRAMTLGKGGEKAILAIIALARSMGLEVIAEGAGEIREARYLRDLGCRYVQGFYFSQAVSFDTALDMLHDPLRYFGQKFIDMDAEWLAINPERRVLTPAPAAGSPEALRGRIGHWFRPDD